MKPEDKELFLKDLCARLPYGVKAYVKIWSKLDKKYHEDTYDVKSVFPSLNEVYIRSKSSSVSALLGQYEYTIKPYLFPLSSITEDQEKELLRLGVSYGEYALHDDIRGLGIMVDEAYIFFEFCYKHHIDFLGLIPKGLATDATGLNIY